MELPEKRKWGRLKRMYTLDAVREDMAVVEVTEEYAEDQMGMENRCGDP